MKKHRSDTTCLDAGCKLDAECKEEMKLSPFGRLFRLFATWFGFTGLYAAFTVCPFCGQQGCPVGMASAGTVGAFLALCLQDWKRLFAYLKNRFTALAHKQPGQEQPCKEKK